MQTRDHTSVLMKGIMKYTAQSVAYALPSALPGFTPQASSETRWEL
jgi:hypothetical protein